MTTTFLPDTICETRRLNLHVDACGAAKPLLRGRLHQLCAVASVPAGLHLLSMSAPAERPASLSYAASWTAMFTTSACYHRLAHSPNAVLRLRRADHSMIFVHIGGTSTALALLCLPLLSAAAVLSLVWATIAGGIAVKLTRLSEGGSAGSWMYGLLGLVQATTLPLLAPALDLLELTLLLTSGLLYTTGAALFFGKRLDLRPTVFGYHEVWHCFTLAAGACQYLLLANLITH